MNVELLTEECRRHRAALDVPARPAPPPRTLPTDLAIFFVPRFPEREIADVFLVVFVAFHPAGRTQFREIEMRQMTVGREID